MAEPFTGTFGKPFAEAVAAFRLRLGNLVPTAKWDDIWQEQHDRAFMVAGATKADLLADLAAAVDKAISSGTSLEEFRRDFRKIVEERGWHGWTGEGTKGGEAWRTRVIYRTNIRTSYAAGRMAQLVEGGFPFWVYRHGGSVEPRIIHLGWDGLVLPPDHPFWATHAPPNGWGCSCYVVGARSFRGAQRLGGNPGKPLPDGWQKRDPKTGAPVGIDRGWAYAPGRSVADEILSLAKDKAALLPRPLAAALTDDTDALKASVRTISDEALDRLTEAYSFSTRQEALIATSADFAGLSPTERAVVNLWTEPGLYMRVNHVLRGGEDDLADELRSFAETLQRALEKLPRVPGVSTRGIDLVGDLGEKLGALKKGDTLRIDGFAASAGEKGRALAGEVKLVMNGHTGRSVRQLSRLPDEDEILFPPRTHWVVDKVAADDSEGYDVLVIELRELLTPPANIVATMSEALA